MAAKYLVTMEFTVEAPDGVTAVEIANSIGDLVYRTDGIDSSLQEVIEVD